MITDNQVKEELSISYIMAVAAFCNFGCEFTRKDIDSIDATITYNGWLSPTSTLRSPEIKLQLKATESLQQIGGAHYSFPLSVKNYDDLRAPTMTPRLLVVLDLPPSRTLWLSHTANDLIIQKCAYWCNLLGLPDSTNATSVNVHLPISNEFSPAILQQLMIKASHGVRL